MKHFVRVRHAESGRVMDMYSDNMGVQFYTGNFLNGKVTGKFNTVYNQRYGLCLETQHFPDSPNQKSFPSTALKPGETFKSSSSYQFSVVK